MEDDPTRHKAEAAVETDEITELLAFERRFDLLKQFQEYADAVFNGRIKSGLLPYQVPAFADIAKFFEKHAQELNTTDQLTISGYLDLPTSFGKSVIMAKIVEAFGIGKTPEGRNRKRKALILVPTQQAVAQTMGEVNEDGEGRGFAKHAPGITTGGYYEHDKDLDADVVVMTYQSFLAFTRRIASGQIVDPDFDLIMCDEAQHTLGPDISAALEAYRQGKIAIGLTATPEYDDDKHIKQLFEHCIHKSELLPLIESGVLNGVQLIGLATGSNVQTSGKGEFTEAELRDLFDDDDRNDIIVEMAKRLTAEGRRGVINALRGQKASHARRLAAMLNGQEVTNERGETITLRAEAISSYMPYEERARILREYKEGLIHVLTQVQSLNENWDEDDIGFIINAAPTASKVVAYQRIGRGMRPNGDWPITVIVELLDDITGRKHNVTAWNVFGEDQYEQGKVFTTPERRERAEREHRTGPKKFMGGTALHDQNVTPPTAPTAPDNRAGPSPADWQPDEPVTVPRAGEPAPPTSQPTEVENPERRLTFDIESLEGVVKTRLDDFTMRVARELTIRPQEFIGPPKPGWIPLVSLVDIGEKKGMGIFAMRSAIMNEGGFGCELAETPLGDRYYVERGARQFIVDYEPLPWAPKTHKTIADMEGDFGVSRQIIEPIIEELKNGEKPRIKGEPMRSRVVKRRLTYYTPAEYRIIQARVDKVKAERPEEDADVVFLSELSKELDVVRGPIQFFLVRHHGIKGKERRSPVTNQKGMAYTKAEADIARFHYRHQEVPKRAKLLEHMEQATGLSDQVIRARIEADKLLGGMVKKGRFADARGDYHYTLFCTEEDFDQVVRLLLQPDTKPEPKPAPAQPPLAPRFVAPETKQAPRAAPPPPAAKKPAAPPLPSQAPLTQKYMASLPEVLRPIHYMTLLRELRCNPAAARYLQRQLPIAGNVIREDESGELYIEAHAATLLRHRCSEIGPPPRTSRSDRYFAERYGCKLTDVDAVIPGLMPEPSQMALFRTDDGSRVITFHYMSKLAVQIDGALRKRFGPPR